MKLDRELAEYLTELEARLAVVEAYVAVALSRDTAGEMQRDLAALNSVRMAAPQFQKLLQTQSKRLTARTAAARGRGRA